MYRNAQVSKKHANVHSRKMFAQEYKSHANVHSGKLFRIFLWFMARHSSWLFYGIYIFVYATYVMMFFILKGKLLTLHKQLEGKKPFKSSLLCYSNDYYIYVSNVFLNSICHLYVLIMYYHN